MGHQNSNVISANQRFQTAFFGLLVASYDTQVYHRPIFYAWTNMGRKKTKYAQTYS